MNTNLLVMIVLFYVLCFMCMKKHDKQLYISAIKNARYFIWLYFANTHIEKSSYKIINFIFALTGVFIFPFISIVYPNWATVIGDGEVYSIVYTVSKDDPNYTVTKNMQSKLFWNKILKKYNIPTPRVVCETPTSCGIHEANDVSFIEKPNFGTQGAGIKEITFDEYKSSNENMILQKKVTDCFHKGARHFRIVTRFINDICTISMIKEFTSQNPNAIASNRVQGGISKVCENLQCSHLSHTEQNALSSISKTLTKLHKNEFKIAPFIGWDVMLTCHGPTVLEGNLGASMRSDHVFYKSYLTDMKRLFVLK